MFLQTSCGTWGAVYPPPKTGQDRWDQHCRFQAPEKTTEIRHVLKRVFQNVVFLKTPPRKCQIGPRIRHFLEVVFQNSNRRSLGSELELTLFLFRSNPRSVSILTVLAGQDSVGSDLGSDTILQLFGKILKNKFRLQ